MHSTLDALNPNRQKQAERLRTSMHAGEPVLLQTGALVSQALQDAWTLTHIVRCWIPSC